MNINYYLDKENKKQLCRVYLFIRGLDPDNHRSAIKIKTSIEIPLNAWNPKKQVIRSSFNDYEVLNSNLYNYKIRAIETIEFYKTENPNISFIELRDLVKNIVQKNETIKIVKKKEEISRRFIDVIDIYIESKRSIVNESTLKRYKVVKNHIIQFEDKYKTKLTLDSFDLTLRDKLIKYFFSIGHLNNTINRTFKQLKTILIWANKRKYKIDINDEAFKFLKYDSDIIYLTDDEIKLLELLDLTSKPHLERIKDLFLFQLHTGQRYGDVQALKFENIINNVWNLRTQKTQVLNKIPLSKLAVQIINKYHKDNRLPQISSQKFNKHIKEICKIAEINQSITITSYRGSEKIVITKPKYELISSHNAKKSFVTKAINGNVDLVTVMNLTGNKDARTLKRYYEILDQTKKDAINNMFN